MKTLDDRYETLLAEEIKPGIVLVTLNRPDRYNAMTNTMFIELELGAEVAKLDVDWRVVLPLEMMPLRPSIYPLIVECA